MCNSNPNLCDEVEMKEKNCTPTGGAKYVYMIDRRSIRIEDVKKPESMDFMPGSRVTWYYSGLKVEPIGRYINHYITKSYIR